MQIYSELLYVFCCNQKNDIQKQYFFFIEEESYKYGYENNPAEITENIFFASTSIFSF